MEWRLFYPIDTGMFLKKIQYGINSFKKIRIGRRDKTDRKKSLIRE
jgi:hypothetical protein